ncbi:AAEL011474-PA [Aedes aegypti]|uniref:AAEL011474-PA n=1 Tax=Aedes aegypti TaxID=7159 RepID=Q16PZ9_AEDAE|nr:AAEL011474-PA [Aedes aegypti]
MINVYAFNFTDGVEIWTNNVAPMYSDNTSPISVVAAAKAFLQQKCPPAARKVMRTRSSGQAHHIWDDPMIEQFITNYSPASSRSHRLAVAPPLTIGYPFQSSTLGNRRRDSVNSSIGATSVRRLLTVNNRSYGCRHKIPTHVRNKVTKNFILLTIAHGLMCTALIPLIGLQGSNSTWFQQEPWLAMGPDVGSGLLSICCVVTALMCLVTTKIIRKFGYSIVLASIYGGLCVFLATHIYPVLVSLVPGYLVLGLVLGPSVICKQTLVVSMAGKLSCSQPECGGTSMAGINADSYDDHRLLCSRDESIRRLGRWFRAAGDFGMIIGTIIAAFILTCASSNRAGCFYISAFDGYQLDRFPYSTFQTNDHGERICGSHLCPVWDRNIPINSSTINSLSLQSYTGTIPLMGLYLICAVVALTVTGLTTDIEHNVKFDSIRKMSDTLLFAGPMAYFIGTEQGYMLADFMKAFVSCELGPNSVAGAMIGMGVMQLIAACTLSMLLRHTKRVVVIIAGFIFHACLLLVLLRWKPSRDDSAVLYVIPAAWGVCNAVWETLTTALVTLSHTTKVAEVMSPLQALRFLGLGITFAGHGILCEAPKIIILAILLVISVIPYTMLELKLETQRKAAKVSL